MTGDIALHPTELVPGRPFTHPQRVSVHQKILQFMLEQISQLLEYQSLVGCQEHVVHFQRLEKGQWFHRLVLAKPEKLTEGGPLTLVGFFGDRLPEADIDFAHELDRILVSEIDQHPGLYSYSTMLLADGNYANLVVFNCPEARANWSTSRAHGQAVNELSPAYYANVSIYNARLTQGLRRIAGLQIVRAKYYDFQSQPCWRAVRELIGE